MMDYKKLKKEAVYYATEGRSSFIEMAKRLKTIRDNKLYKQDNYRGFSNFIEYELPIGRRTVYDYMSAIDYLEPELLQDSSFNYSKFLPLLSLLRCKNNNIPKVEIQKEIIQDIKVGASARQIKEKIKNYKIKYNINKDINMPSLYVDYKRNSIMFEEKTVVRFNKKINEKNQEIICNYLNKNYKLVRIIKDSL